MRREGRQRQETRENREREGKATASSSASLTGMLDFVKVSHPLEDLIHANEVN